VAYITTDPIHVAALMREIRPSDGGVCVFLGVVRNENDGKATVSIQYEAYGPMAESEMAKIARQTEARWPGARLLMRHRTGRLEIGDGTRVRELWATLSREVPLFARFPSPPPAAVNREYVPPETVLRDGDEVAFLPPVAGG